MNNHGRWRLGALASAIALLGMASLEAHALSLGRITVQSALGESLRAEIDVSDLTTEEASSLRISIATVESFKAAGLEYPSAAAGLDVRLQRRADGRPYVRLSSNRAITEPFVDLILEAKWSSGRVTRDYTMLFDPPNLQASSAGAMTPTAPILTRAPVSGAGLPAREAAPAPYSPPARPAARSAPAPKAAEIRTPRTQGIPAGARQVTVKAGDNASRIAAQTKPASVSLDQMLVALLRSNPDAFIGNNINIIKSGAVLDIPDAQAANALSPGEATQTLLAQSRDFNDFRRKLAESAPAARVDSADRQIGGKVQAVVEDRGQANTAPDKLTLSKGAVQGKAASDQEAGDASRRAAELSKNTSERNQPGAVPATSTATAAPGSTVPAPAPGASSATSAAALTAVAALASASAADPSASTSASTTDALQAPIAPASAALPAASAAAATVPAVLKRPVVIAPPLPEPSLMDQIQDNALLLLGAGGLLALLAGLAFTRYRKNKKMNLVDSSFLDSRMQPDSFFGASGGRLIDTNENNPGGSSLAYSPSQIDASSDVDPVAEADVYLAYGRDKQAEEILRDALQTHPGRMAIHTKLLEIYAKRRDNKAFESVALSAFKLSKGQGSEWAYISGLGRDLDPGNSTYKPEGPSDSKLENSVSALMPVSAMAMQERSTVTSDSKNAIDLDLDLDFSLDETSNAAFKSAAIAASSPNLLPQVANPGFTQPSAALSLNDLDFDLNLDDAPPVPVSQTAAVKNSLPTMDFLSKGLDFTPEPYVSPKAPIAQAAPVTHSGMLEFDLNSLSLDLDPGAQSPALPLSSPQDDPLEIKFLLAEEFRILGDTDGARSLADEVLTKAEGSLKVKAQAFLNALS